MKMRRLLHAFWSCFLLTMAVPALFALDIVGKESPETRISINGKSDVTFQASDQGINVVCTPGSNSFPGIVLEPAGGNWDLSSYAGIEVGITNQSQVNRAFFVRVDESNWKNNNSEMVAIKAGASGVLKLTFGYSWKKPGQAINSAEIKKILIFSKKAKEEFKFRVDYVRPFGKPGDKPSGMIEECFPRDGVLVAPTSYPVSEIRAQNATVSRQDNLLKIKFSSPGASVIFPAASKTIWNLSHYNKIVFSLNNSGERKLELSCQVDNNNANGTNFCANAAAALEPGTAGDIAVSFITEKIWDGAIKRSGFVFDSSKVIAVRITAAEPGEVVVERIFAAAETDARLPEWLGKRPPAEGKWRLTFEDDFTGQNLNRQYWNIPDRKASEKDVYPVHIDMAKSWWGNDTGNSSRNAYVEDGMLTIKCEKASEVKQLPPGLKGYKYITSLVDSFGRFSQRYGYFEARMKIPAIRGMWPAFWLMPERGESAGIWWKRQTTTDGGMEFDIMEYLGRYGDYRYNIAMHWDGYKKDHKSVGTEDIYYIPDKEGFVTSGLLWEPGRATFYCNGRKVGVFENERIGNVPGHILFTMPVGGWGTNGIVDDNQLPAYFKIDYVRVWQREDLIRFSE